MPAGQARADAASHVTVDACTPYPWAVGRGPWAVGRGPWPRRGTGLTCLLTRIENLSPCLLPRALQPPPCSARRRDARTHVRGVTVLQTIYLHTHPSV